MGVILKKNAYRDQIKRVVAHPELHFTEQKQRLSSLTCTYSASNVECYAVPQGHVNLSEFFDESIADLSRENCVKEQQAVDRAYPKSFYGSVVDWISGLLGKSHRCVDVIVFVSKHNDECDLQWETYKKLFVENHCSVKRVTNEHALPMKIKELNPILVHCLNPVRANPINNQCVRVATFDYDESGAVANIASQVSFSACGYDGSVREYQASMLFFKRFYGLLLSGEPVIRSYQSLLPLVDLPPKQYLSARAKGCDQIAFQKYINPSKY